MADENLADNDNGPDYQTARTRSVDNLQRLYGFVVGLAVTKGITGLIDALTSKSASTDPRLVVCTFACFLITVVPFFHGANRYLDATYVTRERTAKTYALLWDFVALFLEGLALFTLSMLLTNKEWFFNFLVALLTLDVVWVGFTQLTSEKESDKAPRFKLWAIINIIALFGVLTLNGIEWHSELYGIVVPTVLVAIRTVLDYVIVWKFYYPPVGGINMIPAPLPAVPPNQK